MARLVLFVLACFFMIAGLMTIMLYLKWRGAGWKLSRNGAVKQELKRLKDALEAYHNRHGSYPPSTRIAAEQNDEQQPPTFRTAQDGYQGATLTTPVAYVPDLPFDPWHMPKSPYGYYAPGPHQWIAFSCGPDNRYDIDWKQICTSNTEELRKRISAFRYDPTNGLLSSGDIIRMVGE